MELPHVEALHRELKDQGFSLLTVTKDSAADVLKMVEYNGITHPIVSDTDKVFEKYHAYDGKHYLIAGDGTILAAFSKLGISIPILRRELEKHGIRSSSSRATAPAQSAAPATTGQAPAKQPVVWSAPAAAVSGTASGKFSVSAAVTIAPGWYIYAQSQAPGGPLPLAITLPANQPFTLAGTIAAPKPDVKFDPGFGMEVHQHRTGGAFVLPVTAAAASPGRRTIIVEARYQACNSTVCLPAKTDRIEIPVVIK